MTEMGENGKGGMEMQPGIFLHYNSDVRFEIDCKKITPAQIFFVAHVEI
jgi:hypothetical protein